MRHSQFAAAALAATAALFIAGTASAHAHLVKSTPAANATVAAPKAISLTFSEKLTPAFSKFELTMPGMNDMAVAVKTSVSKDGLTITGAPAAALMPGAYKIKWHAASTDGHKMDGDVAFTVK
ncbi:MAG: copper homeostasis periplasmic binding protein CopC [Phenylobacterium sp.]|uniref:copper homeostasis periplasmic binding protein CopC n=1 Tax=Phenylobacterium sp. TaxID=1871053 RepID=UPI001A47FFA2|nr:copper homeostasis periplasmic binding protein CopC [Phenylobacterium sp.]MBL8552867.1 copper homeostasis periplasmic binding protein CopC [Phenylobacterium sp.]